jgi:hypothetical protein
MPVKWIFEVEYLSNHLLDLPQLLYLSLCDQTKKMLAMKMTFYRRQPFMEDELELAQILNSSLDDQTKLYEDKLQWKFASKY